MKRGWIVLLGIVALAAVGGAWYWGSRSAQVETTPIVEAPPVVALAKDASERLKTRAVEAAANRLGNIQQQHMIELVSSPAQIRFGQDKRDTLPEYCRECDVRFACHGECPKNRFILTPDGEPDLNYLCAGFKEFFHHVAFPMKLMAGLIRRGRDAKEVMAMLERAFAGVQRNDLCPCGSGRKFKQCHGRRLMDSTTADRATSDSVP